MRSRLEELATANRRKDEFLAMLGHELRSPLTSINNGVHLLSHQDTPALQKTKAMLQRQVRRMTQLVHDLLDVSKITHGCLHLQRERMDLRDVVSNARAGHQRAPSPADHRVARRSGVVARRPRAPGTGVCESARQRV
jgi:signal transduction histidine kinase